MTLSPEKRAEALAILDDIAEQLQLAVKGLDTLAQAIEEHDRKIPVPAKVRA
ncbi:MAG: hypothetical protein ACLQQM_02800 [Acidimicrobiales bacterium]